MTPEQHAQVKEIFLEAVERPQDQRTAFLTQRCGGDETLLHEVEKLLAQHESATITPGAVDATVPAIAARADGSLGGSGHAAQPAAASPSKDNDRARFAPGTVVKGRYRIVSRLGKGGMGVVYRADDLTLRQTVALKFLAPAAAANPAWLARFRNEVRLARRVTHPNVCRVYDIGEADGTWFLSMEYVDGEDLATLSRRIGRLSIDKALSMGREICIGLAVAHDVGILHRDLKPANIMIDGRGRIRITDFGLAAATGTVGSGDIRAGTLAYMAPEQIAGHEVTMKSDLYSLGLVLYELFGGQAAFRADSTAGYTELLKRGDPAPLSEVAPDIPAEIDRIIRQCLAKDPQDRPRSALAIAGALAGTSALEAAVAANLTPSPDTIAAATPRASVARQPAWLLAGIGMLLAALVLARSHAAYPWDAAGTKQPAVLLERARQVVRDVGYAEDPVDFAFGFCTPDGVEELAEKYLTRYPVGRSLPIGPGHQLVFWYRQRGEWLAHDHSPHFYPYRYRSLICLAYSRALSGRSNRPDRSRA
jgi:serine/threonine-protein kinase